MSDYKIKDNTAPQGTASAESAVSPSAQGDAHPKENKNFNFRKKHMQINSEVLSSQYGINVFLAGLFLMFASSLNIAWITKKDILCYLITLMLLQILWMLWYMFITKKEHNPKKEKDSHAGARWLRCGIALFAGISLFLDALKLGYFIGYAECLHVSEGILPVTHTVHTLLQVFFLWFHSKDIIQSFKTLERFGLIHSVFTNLLLWASEVFTESKHQLVEHMDRLTTLGFENITLESSTPPCNCSTSVCSVFARAIYYLYPFNIEYHILASAMLYVLWKNIGSCTIHHNEKKKCNFHGIENGSSLGLLVFTTTVAVIVVYFLYIGGSKSSSEMALSVYYFYGIIVLSAMSLASGTGLILYKSEDRRLVEVKSHAIKLDEDLLVGSACGSWLMSWGSILAVIYADSHPVYTWYNLPYSILIIIQKYFQNLFIIECIHRTEQRTLDEDAETVGSVATIPCESPLFPDPPFELFFNDTFTADTEAFPEDDIPKVPLEEMKSAVEMKNKKNEAGSPPAYHQPSNLEKPKKVTAKRKILRNITVFLFLCNISLWIPPAFGCRPQYDNGLEETVFGFRPWIILIDIALPFSIFYRMHSVYSLFDVYRNI